MHPNKILIHYTNKIQFSHILLFLIIPNVTTVQHLIQQHLQFPTYQTTPNLVHLQFHIDLSLSPHNHIKHCHPTHTQFSYPQFLIDPSNRTTTANIVTQLISNSVSSPVPHRSLSLTTDHNNYCKHPPNPQPIQ